MILLRSVLCAYALMCAAVSKADLVSMNIGESAAELVPVKWVADLEEIDSETAIAKFYYETPTSDGRFEVHVSRIFSIEFGTFEKMSRDLPARNSHRDIRSPVYTDVKKNRRRWILLDNSDLSVAELLGERTRVQPKNREGAELKVYGVISHMDDENAILIISEKGGGKASLTLERRHIKTWNRDPR